MIEQGNYRKICFYPYLLQEPLTTGYDTFTCNINFIEDTNSSPKTLSIQP